MTSYYEAHITMLGSRTYIEPIVHAANWKFSAIDGDPVLGAGVKCYATNFWSAKKSQPEVLGMLRGAAKAFEALGIKVTRRKIELVIYDDKSSKVMICDGSCEECVGE